MRGCGLRITNVFPPRAHTSIIECALDTRAMLQKMNPRPMSHQTFLYMMQYCIIKMVFGIRGKWHVLLPSVLLTLHNFHHDTSPQTVKWHFRQPSLEPNKIFILSQATHSYAPSGEYTSPDRPVFTS